MIHELIVALKAVPAFALKRSERVDPAQAGEVNMGSCHRDTSWAVAYNTSPILTGWFIPDNCFGCMPYRFSRYRKTQSVLQEHTLVSTDSRSGLEEMRLQDAWSGPIQLSSKLSARKIRSKTA